MNFDLSDEQRLLQDTIRGFLAKECPPAQLRAVFEGAGHDPTLWKGMIELGLGGLHLPDAWGGAGLELVDLAIAAEVLGYGGAPGPFLGHALAGLAIEGYVRAHEYSSYVQLTRDARGEDPGILQLMSKLNSTNIGSEVAKLALEILGDDGLLDPTVQDEMVYLPNANRSWITQYMYSLGIAIAGGSANVQRNVIAERGLGLPRDWWAQRSAGR